MTTNTTKPKAPKSTQKSLHNLRVVRFLDRKDEDRLIFAAFVLVMTALVVVSTMKLINEERKEHYDVVRIPSVSSKLLTTHQQGITDGYDVMIKDVGVSNEADRAFPLESDEVLLTMSLEITNRTNSQQDFVPVSQIYVRSKDGDYFQLHPSSHVKTPIAAGAILPGQTISGQISFAIPKRLSKPLLYIDPAWDDFAPVVFDVFK